MLSFIILEVIPVLLKQIYFLNILSIPELPLTNMAKMLFQLVLRPFGLFWCYKRNICTHTHTQAQKAQALKKKQKLPVNKLTQNSQNQKSSTSLPCLKGIKQIKIKDENSCK